MNFAKLLKGGRLEGRVEGIQETSRLVIRVILACMIIPFPVYRIKITLSFFQILGINEDLL